MDDSQDCGRGATSSEFTDVERASLHGRIARRRKMCAVTTSRTREEKSTIRARAFASASRVMRRGFERGSEKSWQAAAPIFEKTALTAMCQQQAGIHLLFDGVPRVEDGVRAAGSSSDIARLTHYERHFYFFITVFAHVPPRCTPGASRSTRLASNPSEDPPRLLVPTRERPSARPPRTPSLSSPSLVTHTTLRERLSVSEHLARCQRDGVRVGSLVL